MISEECLIHYLNAIAAFTKHQRDGVDLLLDQYPEVFVRIFNTYLRYPHHEIESASCRIICSAMT